MINIFKLTYKSLRVLKRIALKKVHRLITIIRFKGNGVIYSSFDTNGIPFVSVAEGGRMTIGRKLSMNNGLYGNPIGCPQPCTFFVDKNCTLKIGDNVGISQSALISHCSLEIGNNVKIGGGSCIYTTDFHALEPSLRQDSIRDKINRKNAPVIIENNVFIGTKCIILKGVKIGKNSIIGAGSVVTKNVPENQIWAGNPAKFIREI